MKIVFFGTPVFAKKILQALLNHKYNIVGVVTQPDRPKGRSLKLQPSPVKEYLLEIDSSLPIFQPEKVSTEEMKQILMSLDADLFLVVGYGEIIKSFILGIPKIDCINIHTSYLPKYRGAAPIQRAIENGEKELGISIMKMVKKMDAGDILMQKKLLFDQSESFDEIEASLNELAINMLIDLLPKLELNLITPVPQNENEVTFAPKITNEDLLINWLDSSEKIHNKVRAYSPKPGAFSYGMINGEKKKIKFIKVKQLAHDLPPKTILQREKKSFSIGTGKGSVQPLLVQPEGKKVMAFDSFMRGCQTFTIC